MRRRIVLVRFLSAPIGEIERKVTRQRFARFRSIRNRIESEFLTSCIFLLIETAAIASASLMSPSALTFLQNEPDAALC